MALLKRTGISITLSLGRSLSTVHQGVAFEQRALRLLRDSFSMSLRRVGGRGDGGIDLLGWWWLPQPYQGDQQDLGLRRFRIIGQCKAEKKKMGPKYVRELEGVMYRLTMSARLHGNQLPLLAAEFPGEPASSRSGLVNGTKEHQEDEILSSDEPAIAILVSQSPFTKAALLRAQSSPIPFLLLHLPPTKKHDQAQPLEDPSGSPRGSLPDALGPTSPSLPFSPSPSSKSTRGNTSDPEPVAAAIWNMALGGTQGLLQGQMEVRWERDLTPNATSNRKREDRPGLWWNGTKLGCCIPEGG